jgi:hypothetical protein
MGWPLRLYYAQPGRGSVDRAMVAIRANYRERPTDSGFWQAMRFDDCFPAQS